MKDLIERQAALNALSRGSGCGASCHRAIKALPSAQPEITEAIVKEYCEKRCLAVVDARLFEEMKRRWSSAQPQLPEWAQKVEEYRKSALSHIHNPLAWALYQTWKEYDG